MQSPDALSPDAATTRVMDGMRLLVRELRESSVALEKAHGISASQLFVLRSVAAEPGLSIGALAAKTMTHQSSVSAVVTRLKAQGLVTRSRSAKDRRGVVVAATRKGKDLVRRAPDPFQDRLVAALQQMRSVDRLRLAESFEQWIATLGLHIREPVMFFEGEADRHDA